MFHKHMSSFFRFPVKDTGKHYEAVSAGVGILTGPPGGIPGPEATCPGAAAQPPRGHGAHSFSGTT